MKMFDIGRRFGYSAAIMTEPIRLFELPPAPPEPPSPPPAPPAGDPKLRPINREQRTMAVVDVEELIGPDHKARAIWELVGRLDLSRYLGQIRSLEGDSGRPAWDPRLLVSVWVYALSEGVSKAREIERVMEYEPGFRWLSGLQKINYHTLSDFAAEGGEAVQELFVQLLGLLEAENLINLERVMHDGTKVRAAASGDTFRREGTVQRHLERARKLVREMGEPSPPEGEGLSRREAAQRRAAREREEKVQRALEQLQQLQEAKNQEEEKREVRVSLTDPEARIMKHGDGAFGPSYNVQVSTEAEHRIVLGIEVTQSSSDAEQLLPAIERVEKNVGETPPQWVADGAYASTDNIVASAEKKVDLISSLGDEEGRSRAALKRLGIDPEFGRQAFVPEEDGQSLRCPAGHRLVSIGNSKTHGHLYAQYRASGQDCTACPNQTRCCPQKPERGRLVSLPIEKPQVTAFRQKMTTEEAQKIYRQRPGVAETPHAWIKDKFGIRQFRLRGLAKVRVEAWWAGLAYNIMQWIRLVWRQAQGATT